MVIANPILVRAIAWAKVKTDVAVLAKLHASGFMAEIWMPNKETATRRRVVAERTQQSSCNPCRRKIGGRVLFRRDIPPLPWTNFAPPLSAEHPQLERIASSTI